MPSLPASCNHTGANFCTSSLQQFINCANSGYILSIIPSLNAILDQNTILNITPIDDGFVFNKAGDIITDLFELSRHMPDEVKRTYVLISTMEMMARFANSQQDPITKSTLINACINIIATMRNSPSIIEAELMEIYYIDMPPLDWIEFCLIFH